MKKILLLVAALGLAFRSFAGPDDKMQMAIISNDAMAVIDLGNADEASERLALDALATQFDISKYSYEELLDLLARTHRPALRGYIQPIVIEHEKRIRRHIMGLPPEQLQDYVKSHPRRAAIVDDHVTGIIRSCADSMSYKELMYLDRVGCEYGRNIIDSLLALRVGERIDIFRSGSGDYMKNEQTTVAGLKCLLEKAAWEYFVQAHNKVTAAYARIPMVNDNSYMAAAQYQQLVNTYFKPKLLTEILQGIVDNYCAQVNKSRKEYAHMAGKEKYKSLSYKVPTISLNTNVPNYCLDQIYVTRSEYADNLNTSSTISGVATWLLGPLAGLIAKGIGDSMSIDSLVEGEYNARKEYVDLVHNALRDSFSRYISKLTADIDKSFNTNSQQYENAIKK